MYWSSLSTPSIALYIIFRIWIQVEGKRLRGLFLGRGTSCLQNCYSLHISCLIHLGTSVGSLNRWLKRLDMEKNRMKSLSRVSISRKQIVCQADQSRTSIQTTACTACEGPSSTAFLSPHATSFQRAL